MSLCSSEALGRIEVELDDDSCEDSTLHVGTTDVRDCFYRLKWPAELAEYFCLASLSAAEVRAIRERSGRWFTDADDGPCEARPVVDDSMHACLGVAAMGCSWSLWMAQHVTSRRVAHLPCLAHRAAIADSGDACVIKASDRRPSHFVYVDNVGILGFWRQSVALALEAAVGTLEDVGLATHETQIHSGAAELLGVELNCALGCTRLTDKR